MIVDAVEEDGALEEGERDMIHSIFEMGETTAFRQRLHEPSMAVDRLALARMLRLVRDRRTSPAIGAASCRSSYSGSSIGSIV